MNTEPKICIGIVNYKSVTTRTVLTLAQTIKNSTFARTPYDWEFIIEDGCYVHESRNRIVEFARMKQCTHVFFIDADMAFDGNVLEQLLELDKDIVGAKYNYRHLPFEPMVFEKKDDKVSLMKEEDIPREPFKCFAVGTGCLLIKTSVFDKIEPPYFFFLYTPEGLMECSEDVYFCKKVIDAGLEVWCDPTLLINHQGEYFF